MKYTFLHIDDGEDEVVVKYQKMTPEIENILNFLNRKSDKLSGWMDKSQVFIDDKSILYIESVDGKTFAYTESKVVRLDATLNQLEQLLGISFFRCSKSMIVNISQVSSLKSLPSNRIDATMRNGEHVLISRTYASDFRKRLKGGIDHE